MVICGKIKHRVQDIRLHSAGTQKPPLGGVEQRDNSAYRRGRHYQGDSLRRSEKQTALPFGAVQFRAGLDLPRSGEGLQQAQRL